MKILLPLSWIYGGVMAFRNWLFDCGLLKQVHFDLPIISIGNLAVGGTGKTPHTEYLLNLLTSKHFVCAMLSRGYGRSTKGYHEAKGNTASAVGDEPWQVQQKFSEARVCVCENRVVGIQEILDKGKRPDVILLDDAYQHRYVHPGLSLLLTDYARPYYKDWVMPAGRLREFRKGAKRADLVLVTKCPPELSKEEQTQISQRLSPFHKSQIFFTYFDYGIIYPFDASYKGTTTPLDLSGNRVLLLCGIARPKNLIAHLRPKCQNLMVASFPDHHNFSSGELQRLGEQAKHYDYVITTEKDAARLSSYPLPEELHHRLWVQPIEVKFLNNDSNQFNKIITDYVTENSRNSKVD